MISPPVMTFPWRLYLAATFVGVCVGVIGGAFHALLDLAATSRSALRGLLDTAPVPGWLLLMLLGSLVLMSAMWLVRRFAPEAAGSGVPEVEAILAGERQLRWRRVLPVKFFGGILAVGSGLVLGREGPTIHMGAALGAIAGERLVANPATSRALIAAGAAAGLAAAFNAPLAAIVFVTEELREHFEYRFETIQSVILACCAGVVVSGWMLGLGPEMQMPDLDPSPLKALPLFLVLGVFIGALGVLFNSLLLGSVAAFRALGSSGAYVAAALAGLALGALLWFSPDSVGGGEHLVEQLLTGQPALWFLVLLLAVRLLTSIGSYGLGLPGGIFAPMLALGTLCGVAFAALVSLTMPALALAPEVFAVAAMGALFAATVRAPLTGIILVIELTGAQALALPIILTCLAATFTAEGMGGRPVYSALLGLQQQPPPRAPVRRIAAAAMILVALVAIERVEVAFQGSGMEPVMAQIETERPLKTMAEQVAEGRETGDDHGTDKGADKLRLDPRPPMAPRQEPAPPSQVSADPAPQTFDTESTDSELSTGELSTGELSTKAPPSGPAVEPEGRFTASETPPSAHLDAPSQPSLHTLSVDADQRPQRLPPQDEQIILESAAVTEDASDHSAAPVEPARFSIQLISFRHPASAARFAAAEGLLGRALQIATADQGEGWQAVLFGAYAERADAEAALAELPERLQRLNPIIRTLSDGDALVLIESP